MIRLRIKRLKAVSSDGDLGGASRHRQAAEAVAALEGTLEAIEARLAVLGRHRSGRAPEVLRMLARGDYANFSGVRSAFVDMVRR